MEPTTSLEYPQSTHKFFVVAGGGAGGTRHGGGGGGGGVLLLPQANSTIPNGATYSVVIGAGGFSGQGALDANSGQIAHSDLHHQQDQHT